METISLEDRDGVRWIELEGELDHEVCLELRDKLDEAAGGDADVVIVMSGVSFLGSIGIGILLKLHQKLEKQGRAMHLKAIRPGIRTILDSMHLLTVFQEIEA